MNNELKDVRSRLKYGEYDGADIMAAWIAIDKLIELEQQNEALVTMVKVFKSCIETGVYPIKDSPCYEKINELIGG